MIKFSIRHAKLNELLRIKYITKLAYKIPYKEDTLITKSYEPDNIKSSFSKKEVFIIVAIFNDRIVGAVRYKFFEKNSLYFYKLAVLKTHRNKSIGTSLIKQVEVIAKKKGIAKIKLDCAQEKKIPEYYKKFGYKIDKVKQHQNHHDVYMSKKIEIQ